jgi:hypothetical protein
LCLKAFNISKSDNHTFLSSIAALAEVKEKKDSSNKKKASKSNSSDGTANSKDFKVSVPGLSFVSSSKVHIHFDSLSES